MTGKIIAIACALAVMASAGAVFAQAQKSEPAASPSGGSPAAPQQMAGQVVKIDAPSNMVTVKADDGSIHEFRGNPDTIKDLKVGDRIELTKRGVAR
jgi:hypothetical protein